MSKVLRDLFPPSVVLVDFAHALWFLFVLSYFSTVNCSFSWTFFFFGGNSLNSNKGRFLQRELAFASIEITLN